MALFIGRDATGSKSVLSAYGESSKRLATLRKEEEDERKKQEAQRANDEIINNAIQNGEINADGSEKDLLQKAGDFVGGTAKGMVDSVVDRVNDAGDLVGRTVDMVSGAKEQQDKARRDALAETNRLRAEITNKLYDENGNDRPMSEEERTKLKKSADSFAKIAEQELKDMQDVNNTDKEALDTRKHLTNAAETALDVATAGFGSSVIKGAAKQVAKTAFKQGAKETTEQVVKQGALKTAGKNLAAGASLGAAYSGIDTARDADATVGDYAKNMAVGAGVGGGLGVVGAAVLSGVTKGIAKLNAAKNPQEVVKAADELVQEKKQPLQLEAGYRKPDEIKDNIQRLQNGEDDTVFKYTDSTGEDVTSQVGDFDKEIRARESAIRDLEAQAQGIDNNTGKAEMPAQATGGGGKPTLNVGMNVGDKTTLTPRKIKNILKKEFDIDVKKASTQVSDTEPTYIPELSRPLTQDELYRLSELTGQDAIAHHTGETGMLAGPKAKDWGGEFNAEYYLDADGNSFASKTDPSEYTGDTLARNNAAQAVEKLALEVQDLKARQETAFQSLGGVSREIDTKAAATKFKELQEELAQSVEYNKNVQAAATQDMARNIDVDALDAEAARLRAGDVGDDFVKEFKPAETADDVNAMMRDVDPQDSMGFIHGAQELARDRAELTQKLDNLFTQDNYNQAAKQIDDGYFAAKAELEQLPDPIQPAKMEELNNNILQQYDEIDGRRMQDAEQVQNIETRMAATDDLESAMVQRARAIQMSDPDTFRPIDNTAVNKRLQEIEYQKSLAQDAQYESARQTVQEVQSVGMDLKQASKESPVVAKSVDKIADTDTMGLSDNTGKSAGLGWLIGVPTNVMRKFGKTGSEVADVLADAVSKKENLDGVFHSKMEGWGKLVKGKDGTEKIAKALDGDEAALKSLNKNQTQAYTEMKAWFDDYADQLGIPKEGRIKDYLPHIMEGKDFDGVEQSLAYLRAGKKDGVPLTDKQVRDLETSVAGLDANTLAYLASRNSYNSKNGFLKKRKGAKGDYSLDLEKIVTLYHSKASADIAYKPAIAAANDLTPNLTKEQNSYVTAVFNALQGETDTVIEKSIDGALSNLSGITGRNLGGSGTTGRLSRGARNAIYNATIGGNVGSAIRNTQQMVNVFTEVGGKAVLESAPRALAALKKGSPLRDELYRNGVLSNRQGSYLQGGAMPKFKDKSTRALWGMFNTTESLNRATAYFAGKDRHLAKFPDDFAGAEKAGAELAQKTNFKFSAIDIPVAMQGDMAKNFLQMQTYNVQQTQYIAKMLGEAGNVKNIFTKGADGKYKMNLEPQLKLARFIGGNAAFFGTIGAATGMSWEEGVPFLNDIKAGQVPRSPMYQTIFGDGKANKGLVGSIASGTGALFSGDWEQAGKDVDAFARSAARTFVPAGNQAIKSIEGGASAASGVSTTGSGITDTIDKGLSALNGTMPGGNVRFMQGTDAWSKFKATVLGQYSTQEGRDWVDEGMNNVPANLKINGVPASTYIKQLPRQNQEQYVSYYSMKGPAEDAAAKAIGSSKTEYKDKIVSGLKDGSINENQAIRMAADYNSEVIKSMNQYLQGNRNIPSRLYEDLSKNMLLNYQSMSNSAKRTQSLSSLEKELGFMIDDTGEEIQE